MATTVDYCTYIIDLSNAMLDHRRALTPAQVQRITMIHNQMVNFLTDYLQHESSSLPELLHYLGKRAASPVRIVIGCCDMILNKQCGEIVPAYAEALNEIRDCGYAIYNDLQDMHENLAQLMSELGLVE